MEEKNKLNILFAGNGSICLEVFENVVKNFNVVGVLTGLDKKVGRKKIEVPPEIKVLAEEKAIPVIQVEHLRTPEREVVKKLEANFLLSFSFGRIFGPKFLALFDKGTLNIHPSALPEARGPSPVRAAILSEKKSWALSFQKIGLKMDEGDLFDTCLFPLTGDETEFSLNEKVSKLAVQPTIKILNEIEAGEAKTTKQIGEVSYCGLVKKEDGLINFDKPALTVHSQIRANWSWPKAYCYFNNKQVFITKVFGNFEDFSEEAIGNFVPGEIVDYQKKKGLGVMCRDNLVYFSGFQFVTKKEINYKDFMNQFKDCLGQFFTEDEE